MRNKSTFMQSIILTKAKEIQTMNSYDEKILNFEIFVFGKNPEFKIGVDTVSLTSTQQTQTSSGLPTKTTYYHEKIAAWDGIETQTKTTCVKWASSKFPPFKTCVGWKTEMRRLKNEVWLSVSSPTIKDVKKAVEIALSDAAVAAALVGLSTGGAAAIAAFEYVFIARLTQEIKDAVVHISNPPKTFWGNWHKV